MQPMSNDYNKLSETQRAVWARARPLFERAMQTDFRIDGNVLRVADLGCSGGGNSVAPLRWLWRAGHRCGADSISVLLNDLPTNSWDVAMRTVTPATLAEPGGADEGDGREMCPSKAFVQASGRSFYEQVAPAGSLHLAYSFVAVHWMQRVVEPLPSGCYATDPLHCPEAASLARWRAAAAEDWAAFLDRRAAELQVGGKLIVTVACAKLNGDYPWSRVGHALYQGLLAAAEEDGQEVTAAELADYVLPCSWRSREEVEGPFRGGARPLRLDSLERIQTPCPSREALAAGTLSPGEFADRILDNFLAVGRGPLEAALARLDKSQVDKVVDSARRRANPVIASDPDTYQLDVAFWYLLATRMP